MIRNGSARELAIGDPRRRIFHAHQMTHAVQRHRLAIEDDERLAFYDLDAFRAGPVQAVDCVNRDSESLAAATYQEQPVRCDRKRDRNPNSGSAAIRRSQIHVSLEAPDGLVDHG